MFKGEVGATDQMSSSVPTTLMTMSVKTTNFLVVFIVVAVLISVLILSLIYQLCFRRKNRDYNLIGSEFVRSHDLPFEFLNDEESLRQLSEEFEFKSISPEEQASYSRAEAFCLANPPHFHNIRGRSMTREDELIVKERGIQAFEFEQDFDSLQPRYVVHDKTEISFVDNDTPYSTATSSLNYCLPVKNRSFSNTVYFETKIFEFDDENNTNGHFSIGLITKPYPTAFRLPGYNNFSIAYESTGNLKINKPLPTPLQQHMGDQSQFNALVLPPLSRSDVVGFGYHIPTGTVFITRNGKKIMDVMKGLFVDVYPAVGCFLTNGKFHVNLGQLGFVWIEANVRKYGFISTSDYKKLKGDRGLASLPQYGTLSSSKGDQLLDKGEELPPGYPEEEIDFFGRSKIQDRFNNIGSSSKSNKWLSEKIDDDEYDEDKEHNSASTITNDPEDVMDLRERLYERNTTSGIEEDDDSNDNGSSENSPLLKTSPDPSASTTNNFNNYGSSLTERENTQVYNTQSPQDSSQEFGSSQELHSSQGSAPATNVNKKLKNKKKKKSKKKLKTTKHL